MMLLFVGVAPASSNSSSTYKAVLIDAYNTTPASPNAIAAAEAYLSQRLGSAYYSKYFDFVNSTNTSYSYDNVSYISFQYKMPYSNGTIIPQTNGTFIPYNGALVSVKQITTAPTIYLGKNLSGGPFVLHFDKLGAPNANGSLPAIMTLYYNDVPVITNVTLWPYNISKYNLNGNTIYIRTMRDDFAFGGYLNWMNVQLFTNATNATPLTYGNKLEMATPLTNITLVYVGRNLTSYPFIFNLEDRTYTKAGLWGALATLYYKGVPVINNTVLLAGDAYEYDVDGSTVYPYDYSVVECIYCYQIWGGIQLLTSIFNITGMHVIIPNAYVAVANNGTVIDYQGPTQPYYVNISEGDAISIAESHGFKDNVANILGVSKGTGAESGYSIVWAISSDNNAGIYIDAMTGDVIGEYVISNPPNFFNPPVAGYSELGDFSINASSLTTVPTTIPSTTTPIAQTTTLQTTTSISQATNSTSTSQPSALGDLINSLIKDIQNFFSSIGL